MSNDKDTFKGIADLKGNIDKTAEAEPLPPMLPPAAYEFPWPAIRDFVSIHTSLMLAQQNLMIGEQMLAAGHPSVNEAALQQIRDKVRELTQIVHATNARVEAGIIAFEGKGPRLILPR